MIPSSARAALAITVPWEVRMMASTKGISEPWIAFAELEVAAADRSDEPGVAVGDDIAHDADHTGGAAREVGQVEFIDAAVVGERRAGHDGHRFEQVALGVLDRSDPVVAGEFDQRGRLHGDACAGGTS